MGAGISLVPGQTVSGTVSGGANHITLVLPNNPTTNNLVVVGTSVNTSTAGTVKDSNNNTYSVALTSNNNWPQIANSGGIFYLVAPANATKTITVSFGGITFGAAWAAEFSGTATSSPFDQGAAVNTQTGSTINGPTITPTSSGDLLFAIGASAGTSNSFTINSPFTGLGQTVEAVLAEAEWQVQTASTAATPNISISASDTWGGMIASFSAQPVINLPRNQYDWPVPQAPVYWDKYYSIPILYYTVPVFPPNPTPVPPAKPLSIESFTHWKDRGMGRRKYIRNSWAVRK